MLITKRSHLTGANNTRDVPVEPSRYHDYTARRAGGVADLIQNEFPELSRDDREFILTGVTPEEWSKIMKEDV